MATTLDKPNAAPPAPPQAPAPPPTQQPMEPLLVQCASCGSPIAFDQTYCLECGTKNQRSDSRLSRFKTRRYLLGGLGVLLAVGGIVGYAAAAASRHDAVKIATKSVAPPAPPASQAAPSTPPPGAAAPPATNTPSPTPPAPPAHATAPPATSHPSAPAPAAPTHTSTPSTSGTPSTTTHSHQATPSHPSTTPKPAYAKLFSSGRSPVSAGKFDPNGVGGVNENSLTKVFDDDASTVWKSGTYANGIGNGVGFYVDDGAPGTIKGLGLLAKTPGFDVQVYGYNGDTPPQQLSGWSGPLGSKTNAGQRNNIGLNLGGKQYQLYLVWFTKLPANSQRFEIPEVQLLP